MKKFLAIAAIAGTLVACGNNAENTSPSDSTASAVDTTTVTNDAVTPLVDTAAATTADTATANAADTAHAH